MFPDTDILREIRRNYKVVGATLREITDTKVLVFYVVEVTVYLFGVQNEKVSSRVQRRNLKNLGVRTFLTVLCIGVF